MLPYVPYTLCFILFYFILLLFYPFDPFDVLLVARSYDGLDELHAADAVVHAREVEPRGFGLAAVSMDAEGVTTGISYGILTYSNLMYELANTLFSADTAIWREFLSNFVPSLVFMILTFVLSIAFIVSGSTLHIRLTLAPVPFG